MLSKWCGRFGNNVFQLCNAIQYCKKNNFVFESSDHPLINRFIFNNHIKYSEIIQNHNFFYGPATATPEEKFDIIQNIIKLNLKQINIKNINEETLVVHIRSGDIFDTARINSYYIQNPLNYFLKIIDQYKETIVIYENNNNPIIDELIKNRNIKIESNDFATDLGIILGASNLCLSGVGTLGPVCSVLSNKIKKLHVTNLVSHMKMIKKLSASVYIDEIKLDLEKYIKPGDWKNTKEQRDLMIKFQLE